MPRLTAPSNGFLRQALSTSAHATVALVVSVIVWLASSVAAVAVQWGVLDWRRAEGVDAGSNLITRTAYAGALLLAPLIVGASAYAAGMFAFGGRWGVPRAATAVLSATLCLSTVYLVGTFAAVSNKCDLGISFPPFPFPIDCD